MGHNQSEAFETLYQIFFYAVLFSIAANYYGQLENVSQGYIKTEWLKIPVVLNVPILFFFGLILFSLMQLASATEQRMTGGQYLNREPVSREDFEAYGLGTVSNKASSTELYLDVLKRSLVNLIFSVLTLFRDCLICV